MKLGKDALKILSLTNAHEEIDFEDACVAVSDSVHAAYTAEDLKYLEKNGLIAIHEEMRPEGYQKTRIRITPEGKAELQGYKKETREKLVTRSIAIIALILSAISIAWQIFSTAMQ